MATNEMLFVNQMMELIWISNGSSMGLSLEQQGTLLGFWSKLSLKGIEFFKNWASENDLVIPAYCSLTK